jgi:hypothetical protein
LLFIINLLTTMANSRGCVSGAQIGTLRELCDNGDGEYDYNVIDGYDEME